MPAGPVSRQFCVLPESHPARWLREVGWPATWRKVFVSGPCTWCGNQMVRGATSMDHLPRYCSQSCRHAAEKSWINPDDRRAIYERDDWICQLCLDPVSPDLSPSDIWAATLDHIIPRSHGGSDEEDNLQLAHRWCNSVKGDGTYYDADILKVG